MLTISGHANSQALLEPTLLAAVPVNPHDGAVLHLKTLLVLDVLLDAPPEKALENHKVHMRNITHYSVNPQCKDRNENQTEATLRSRNLSHLAALTSVHAIVEARSNIAAHLAQQHHAVDFCQNKDKT